MGMGRRAFGNVGQINDIDLALGRAGVTPVMSQQIVTDQFRQMSVAAACRGEINLSEMTSDVWMEREYVIGETLTKLGLPAFFQGDVAKAAEAGVGIYDRFVPAGLTREPLLEACGKAGIKLYQGNVQAANNNGDDLPTKASVFTLNYADILRPTNAEHHPFMLNYDQQWEWATEQGGRGFSTAEECLYVAVLRPYIEMGYLPYMGGSIRCQNPFGSDNSLYVYFNAGDGLLVYYWRRSAPDWDLGALPRKSRELGT